MVARNNFGLARSAEGLVDPQTQQFIVGEVNTIPGFTPASMYPKLWQAIALQGGAGRLIAFDDMREQLSGGALECALLPCRHQSLAEAATSLLRADPAVVEIHGTGR